MARMSLFSVLESRCPRRCCRSSVRPGRHGAAGAHEADHFQLLSDTCVKKIPTRQPKIPQFLTPSPEPMQRFGRGREPTPPETKARYTLC